MIRSMTAFARCEHTAEWGNALWELRSVNNRYLEISSKLPEEVRPVEAALRERVRGRLNRGKVDCLLRITSDDSKDQAFEVNMGLAKQLIAAGSELAGLIDGGRPLTASDVLRWPGVVKSAPLDVATITGSVLELLDRALDQLVETREREGHRIAELVEQRLAAMDGILVLVQERLPTVLEAARARLVNRLGELRDQLDHDRVEQEMVILAQKLDVAEELDRLGTHITEVRRVLARDEPVGRRLDFLMQELNREANTLGSKSADKQTTQASVDLKVLIEQMREQIQNVE